MEQFSPEDSDADMRILYEVTGFKAESDNFKFWENYGDFEELGGSDNLVREDKNEETSATKNQTK